MHRSVFGRRKTYGVGIGALSWARVDCDGRRGRSTCGLGWDRKWHGIGHSSASNGHDGGDD